MNQTLKLKARERSGREAWADSRNMPYPAPHASYLAPV